MTPDSIDPRYPIGRFARAASYTAEQRADHVARIGAQPARLATILEALTEQDFDAPYRPDGWTVRQLVHHMADSHMNAFIRVKLGLTESHPTIKPYDQDAWVALADNALSPHVSLALFASVHIRWHTLLQSMTPEQFARSIMHPENGDMTLDQLTALYAWHGDHHLAQLERYGELYRG